MRTLIKIIILIGIFLLPLINSRITNLLGFSFGMPVNGNFEFTKVMFFNIWSSVVVTLFFFKSFLATYELKRITNINILLFLFYILLGISTYFSTSPYISLFGNEIKGHSFLMWSNLVGLFLVLYNIYSKNFFKRTIQTFILSGVLVSIIGLKEYFIPSFNYGDLGNRLFSTFGHPNYVSIFLVALLPFLYQKNYNGSLTKIIISFSIILLFTVSLLFTKSVFAIFLFVCLTTVYFFSKGLKPSVNELSKKKSVITCQQRALALGITGIIIICSFLLFSFFPEKLHSFISRFFIWETSIKIILSDIKIFLIGGGSGTFIYFFDNFKSEYLYIFENLGFSADRPHNLFLNFFYHFGILSLVFISGIYYSIFKLFFQIKKFIPELISLVLILLFLLLNFASIVLYVLIIVLLVKIITDNADFFSIKSLDFINYRIKEYSTYLLLLTITLVSFYGSHISYKFYISETFSYNNEFLQAKYIYKFNPVNHFYSGNFQMGIYYSKIKTQEYYYAQLFFERDIFKKSIICEEYISDFNFSETFFFCGDIFWDLGQKEKALEYYTNGLDLLPDLWNKDSKYYNKFLIKHFNITGNRFLSKKYGLAQVLERVGDFN